MLSMIYQLEAIHKAIHESIHTNKVRNRAFSRQKANGEKFCSFHQRLEPIELFDVHTRGKGKYYESSCREGTAIMDSQSEEEREILEMKERLSSMPRVFSTSDASKAWGMATNGGSSKRLRAMVAAGLLRKDHINGKSATFIKV